MPELRAGAARADMTPPVGTPLAGFWSPRPAEGIDTPLAAHALVLDDGAARLALVGVDLIALPRAHADEAKRRIHHATGIAPGNVLISCSHTHEGPYPCPLLGRETGADPAYMGKVLDAVVAAAAQAAGDTAPAEVGFGSTRVAGLCENRRRLKAGGDVWNRWMLPPGVDAPPAGPVDEELGALAVRTTSGEPLGLLWNFTLHAHAFAADRVSADYPYYVWRRLTEDLGEFVSVFTAGACGDINRRLDVRGVDDPLACVARGTSIFLENLNEWKDTMESGEDQF